MKKLIFLIIITSVVACRENKSEVESESDITLQKINYELHFLGYVLESQGVKFDRDCLIHLSDDKKISYFTEQLKKCRMVTHQFTKFDIPSDTVKMNSSYFGSVFLAGYNENLKNKLVLSYENDTTEYPLNKDLIQFEYKLKPAKKGENAYYGYILQDDDTFSFKGIFYVN